MKLCFTLLSLLFSTSILADSFRCGHEMISSGETKGVIIAKCGKPFSAEVLSYDTKLSNKSSNFQKTETPVEQLLYRDNGVIYNILTLKEGKLFKVDFARCSSQSPQELCD